MCMAWSLCIAWSLCSVNVCKQAASVQHADQAPARFLARAEAASLGLSPTKHAVKMSLTPTTLGHAELGLQRMHVHITRLPLPQMSIGQSIGQH